jgi:hypothetical protein
MQAHDAPENPGQMFTNAISSAKKELFRQRGFFDYWECTCVDLLGIGLNCIP